jgi:hypothetical protein
MERTMSMRGKIVVVIGAFAGAGCYAEPAASSWDYAGTYNAADPTYAGDTVLEPPAEYVATTQPVYFSGHGTYYYGHGWRYRARGQWNSYRQEPATLHQYRVSGHGSTPSSHRYEAHASGAHGRR